MLWFVCFVGLLFALAFVVLAPVCWRAGRGRVPASRRLLVAAALAAGTAAPALPTMGLGFSFFQGIGERVIVHEGDAPDVVAAEPDRETAEREVRLPTGSPDAFVVLVLWFGLLNTALQNLRLPRNLRHLLQLPPVSEPSMVARITELAARLGLRPPLVLETATVGGTMEVQAFAAGLLAPVVVISDGIAHRLQPAERDAVLAHELAHVRHRSVLRHFVAMAMVGLATALLSGLVPFYLAFLWYLGALRLLRTLVGHSDELRADLTAARCVGFAEVAAGLDKIHAAGLQTDPTPWFHAVLSHPAPAVRAFHLARAAPDGSGARIEVDAILVQRCRRARWIAVLLWAALLAAVALLGVRGQWGAAAILGAVMLVVPLLPYLAFVRELRDAFQIHGWTAFHQLRRKTLWIVEMIGAVFGCLYLLRWMPEDSWLAWLPWLLALAVVVLFWRAGRRARRAYRELELLLLRRDLAGYLRRFERLAPRQQRLPELRLNVLLVRAALGAGQAAVEDLKRVQQDWPRFRDAQHWAAVLLSRIDPPRAVERARALLAAMPGNAIIEGTLAAVLRRDGKADEAWQRIANVVRRRPKHGQWHATAALIALARGDMPSATAALAKAERLDPGGSTTVLARAELDVATRAASAAASVRTLRVLTEQLPLAFLGDDAARLEGRLASPSTTGGERK
ncbi:MAG TPA: M48 family metalloprotease [Planctomycetota bacterium]|nr:M48 family metalloprotease [Planctomycetota bacterium]